MRLPRHLTLRNGRLTINGQDAITLAEKYGTPIYVTSGDRVMEQIGSSRTAALERPPWQK